MNADNFAEQSLGDQLSEIAVRGCDDPGIPPAKIPTHYRASVPTR
jgi:hypothetical protein